MMHNYNNFTVRLESIFVEVELRFLWANMPKFILNSTSSDGGMILLVLYPNLPASEEYAKCTRQFG